MISKHTCVRGSVGIVLLVGIAVVLVFLLLKGKFINHAPSETVTTPNQVSTQSPPDATSSQVQDENAVQTIPHTSQDVKNVSDAEKITRDDQRIRDIKYIQLSLALALEYEGKYPASLSELYPTYMTRQVPHDPRGIPYSYVSCDGNTYHLGASLEIGTSAALTGDMDLIPLCGSDFNGSDSQKCSANDVGSFCFDVTSYYNLYPHPPFPLNY